MRQESVSFAQHEGSDWYEHTRFGYVAAELCALFVGLESVLYFMWDLIGEST